MPEDKRKPTKSQRFGLMVTPELAEQINLLAGLEHKPFNAVLTTAVERYIDDRKKDIEKYKDFLATL